MLSHNINPTILFALQLCLEVLSGSFFSLNRDLEFHLCYFCWNTLNWKQNKHTYRNYVRHSKQFQHQVTISKRVSIFKQRQIETKILQENNSLPSGKKGALNHSQIPSCIPLSVVLIHKCRQTFTEIQRHFATSRYLRLPGKFPVDTEAQDSKKCTPYVFFPTTLWNYF